MSEHRRPSLPLWLLFISLAAFAVACNDAPPSTDPPPSSDAPAPSGGAGRRQVHIGEMTVRAEVAMTPERRGRGLSGRTSLPEDAGMLFVFEQEQRPAFWMRDMLFSLDFIWISADGRVVDLTLDVPPPAPASRLPTYQPAEPVLYMLEVNAGVVQRFGVQVGDAVTFEPPFPAPTPNEPDNLFANPSFEDGAQPWFSLTTPAWGMPFTVSGRRAHTGTSGALLELRSAEEGAGAARVYGVVQEIAPGAFPEVISGYYYVDRWERGTPKQYLQFVIIVFDATEIPPEALPANNHQIRYLLAGVDSPPIQIGNARFVMVGAGEPEQGRWVYFERNLRRDFEQLWGAVPEGFSGLRLLFEVRWDDRQRSDSPSAADVYYDSLYIGPARTDAS